MLELEQLSKVRLTDVEVLSAKNREPDAGPGGKLSFEGKFPNDILSMLDGRLKSVVFERNGAMQKVQQGLDGVDAIADLPNLTAIGRALNRFAWNVNGSGYRIEIDLGLGTRNLVIDDCLVEGMRLQLHEGGTVTIKWKVESQDMSKATFGELAMFKNRELSMKQTAPTIAQQDIEDKPPRREPLKIAASPKARAARAAENEKQIKPARADGTANSEGWPFPEGDKPKDATEIFAAGAAGDAAAATT